MRKLLSKPAIWIAGGTIALVGTTAVAYWLVQNVITFLPAGSKLVPQTALATLSVSTNPQQWEKLQQLGPANLRDNLKQKIQNLQQTFLTASGFDYQRDIQPWIGSEVMIGYLPQSDSQTPGKWEDSLVLVLPVAQPWVTPQVASQLSKVGLTPRNYKGVMLQESPAGAQNPFSVTVLDNAVVVTNSPKTMEMVVDAQQSGTTIANLPGYAQALSKLNSSQAVAQLYLNLPEIQNTLGSATAKPVGDQASFQGYQGIATSIDVQSQNIRLQGVSWLKPDSKLKFTANNQIRLIPQKLPADTLFIVSGSSMQQFWLDLIEGQGNPLLPVSPEAVRSGLKSYTNLDLDADLLDWMRGEFALALVPSRADVASRLKAGLVLMVQASDRSKGEAAMKKLDDLAVNNYKFQIETTQLNGQGITNWISPLPGVNASHGWLDGNVAFLTFGAPIAANFVPQPQQSLASNSLFQQVLPGLNQPHNSKLYLNVEQAINAGNSPLPQLPKNWRESAAAVNAIGMTTVVASNHLIRFDMLIQLKAKP